MASYDQVAPDYSHKIPRKRIASDLVTGLESPSDEKHSYGGLGARLHGRNDTQYSQPATNPVRERSPFRWWSLEILSILAAAGCLGGIVALLIIYDGRPQQSWSNDVLTLNGLVALLASLCRMFFMVAISAALTQGKWNQLSARNEGSSGYWLRDFVMFDEAARGPWGSLRLIWRFKGLHIACLGAALTVLSLAFGLFSQQLIALEINILELPSLEDVGRVSRASWVNSLRPDTTSGRRILPTTKLAIYDGYMASVVDDSQVHCATGNCTWPIIPTVGVCGACVDMTDRIEIVNATTPVCVVSAPGDLELRGSCTWTDFAKIVEIGPGSGEVFSSIDEGPPDRDASNIIAEFGVLGIPAIKPANTTINGSIAAECALWYCVQAHSIRVHQGELRDEITHTWSKIQEPDEDISSSVGNISFTDIPASFHADPGELYGIEPRQMYTIRTYFNQTVFGNVSIDGSLGAVFPFNDFSEGLHIGLNDLDLWIERFAKSMTNDLRAIADIRSPGEVRRGHQNPTASDIDEPSIPRKDLEELARYRGTAEANQVTIAVRWQWLIYPAGMVALATLYLIFEATRTSLLPDVRPWKDDLIVPLCMDLDASSREVARTGLIEPRGAHKLLGNHEMEVKRGEGGFPVGFAAKQY